MEPNTKKQSSSFAAAMSPSTNTRLPDSSESESLYRPGGAPSVSSQGHMHRNSSQTSFGPSPIKGRAPQVYLPIRTRLNDSLHPRSPPVAKPASEANGDRQMSPRRRKPVVIPQFNSSGDESSSDRNTSEESSVSVSRKRHRDEVEGEVIVKPALKPGQIYDRVTGQIRKRRMNDDCPSKDLRVYDIKIWDWLREKPRGERGPIEDYQDGDSEYDLMSWEEAKRIRAKPKKSKFRNKAEVSKKTSTAKQKGKEGMRPTGCVEAKDSQSLPSRYPYPDSD